MMNIKFIKIQENYKMDLELTDYIIPIINNINNKIIIDKNITVEDLKSLLLIIFNECLSKDEPNLLIKSYLTVTIGNFINLENYFQQINDNQEQEDPILKNILNKKIREDQKEDGMCK